MANFTEKLTLVVDTSLDACAEVDTQLGLLVLQLVVQVRGHVLREEGVVVLQIGALGGHVLAAEGGTLLFADVLIGTATLSINSLVFLVV